MRPYTNKTDRVDTAKVLYRETRTKAAKKAARFQAKKDIKNGI